MQIQLTKMIKLKGETQDKSVLTRAMGWEETVLSFKLLIFLL